MATNSRVVVVGASGFGRECLDVLDAMIVFGSTIRILGVVDDSPSKINLQRLQQRNVKFLGSIDDWMRGNPTERYLLGIGDPKIRSQLAVKLDDAGIQPTSAVHPSAVVGAATDMEAGTIICAGALISTNVSLGRHVHINPGATVGHDCNVGAFVSVNPAAVVSGNVDLKERAMVGAGAVILQQLVIGEGATVGAGAVVTKDVLPGVTVKGVPAR